MSSEEGSVPLVLVTGASGYVATHLIKMLLEKGEYRVRGTVRDKSRQEKVCQLTVVCELLSTCIVEFYFQCNYMYRSNHLWI